MKTAEVAFVGLGKMGQPMVRRLLATGRAVRIYSRSASVISEMVASGAVAASSAADAAAEASIVMTALPTPDSVDAVFGEFATVADADQIYVDHSTIRPDQNRHWAARMLEKGAGYLDAPVSGGPAGAANGTLTVMVGGTTENLERVQPFLEAFGKTIRLCGPIGAGQAIKLVNQLLVGVHTAAISEAAVFGVKMGVDPQLMLDLIGQSYGGSTMMTRNMPRFMSRDFAAATPTDVILKDLGLIHDEAKTQDVPLLLGGLAEQRFLEAHARGWGGEDMAGLVRLWEEAAGVEVGGIGDGPT